MLVSEGSPLNYVIAFCDVIVTIKAHACSDLIILMLSPCDRRVGRTCFPSLSEVYQLRLATSSATDADQISSDAQLKQNKKLYIQYLHV